MTLLRGNEIEGNVANVYVTINHYQMREGKNQGRRIRKVVKL